MDRQQPQFPPLKMGVRTVGALGVGGNLSRQTLDAMGSLIAIAVERANAVEKLTRSGATRERRTTAFRYPGFRHPRVSNPAHFDQSFDHQFAVNTGLSSDDRRELMTVINEEATA